MPKPSKPKKSRKPHPVNPESNPAVAGPVQNSEPVAEGAISFDLIPPTTPQAKLANVESEFRQVETHLHDRLVEVVYVAAWGGAILMKLKDLYCREQATRFGARHGADTVSAPDDEAGFYTYLAENFCPTQHETETDHERYIQSRLRHFRRLMNVARHATLTGDSTLEDLQHIRKLGLLEGKTLTDLYKPLKLIEDAQDTPPPARNLIAETSTELSRYCAEIVKLRDDTEPDLYEANVTLLRATLESYTGHPWDYAQGPDGAHAEPSSPAPAKRSRPRGIKQPTPGLTPEARANIAALRRARWAAQRRKS